MRTEEFVMSFIYSLIVLTKSNETDPNPWPVLIAEVGGEQEHGNICKKTILSRISDCSNIGFIGYRN